MTRTFPLDIRYRISLEQVSGPFDDETIEIKDSWTIGNGQWRNDREMLDSIQAAVSKAIRSKK